MIDLEMDKESDRELHDRFIEVYRQHMTAVNLWPPMDVYELFWRLGRSDDVFVPGEGVPSKSAIPNPQSEIPG